MTLWKDSLLIGVNEIDAQHKRLVEAIDDLMEAAMQGKGTSAIQKTLDFVESYTKQHFSDEEKLLAENGYPLAFVHKQLHTGFITTISGLKSDFAREGATSSLSIKLNKVLVDWLVMHITTEDRKYAAFLNEKQ